jgi:hypoxanthine-DNA glycosylase
VIARGIARGIAGADRACIRPRGEQDNAHTRRTDRVPHVHSFEPVAAADARILILGSMPGTASLAATRYYAHPRNLFWPILADVLHFDASGEYEARLDALKSARVALWDVLHSCHREGSLDTRIRTETQVANDFAAFFRTHPGIVRVIFNGAKAAQCYDRRVLREGIGTGLHYERLPSTSPANASWSYERKLAVWRNALLEGEKPSQELPRSAASLSTSRAG